MTAKIYIDGVIGKDFHLLDIIHQFNSYKGATAIEVIIDSVGGSVDVGQSIFKWLRNQSENGLHVTTIAKKAYSIASVIFLAGDKRVVEGKLLLHLPFASFQGRSNDFAQVAIELKDLENEFVDFYSIYMNTDKDTIRQLLENETYVNPEEALSLGLATEIRKELNAVAFFDNDNEVNKKTIMSKTNDLFKALKTFLGGEQEQEQKLEIKALVIQDANGAEINFPALEGGAEPSKGDVAEIDGNPAQGEYTTTEGAIWTFVDGVLDSIVEPEQEEQEEEEEEISGDEFEELLKQLFAKAKDEVKTEMKVDYEAIEKQNKDLTAEVMAMKKLIGSSDLEEENNEQVQTKNKNFFK